MQTSPHRLCVCVYVPTQVLDGWGQAEDTRCYLCDLFTTSSLKGIFQAVCWWRMVRAGGETSVFFKNGNLCCKKLTVLFRCLQEFKDCSNLVWFHFFTVYGSSWKAVSLCLCYIPVLAMQVAVFWGAPYVEGVHPRGEGGAERAVGVSIIW